MPDVVKESVSEGNWTAWFEIPWIQYSEEKSFSNDIQFEEYDPAVKNNLDLVQWAIQAHENGWGYVYGTYGNVLTESLLQDRASVFGGQVTSYMDFIRSNWMGKRTADCVGLIKGYGWYNAESGEIVVGSNGMMDETTKNQVLAQASFLRAMWYFQVNLLWDKGTMPLEPKDANYIPEDASEQEIWDQVEKDLLFAMDYLPESWDAANLGRATKGAAKALLGKAYMQQHKYDKAKEQLQWLIDKEGSLYDLIANREDNFTDLDENNKEGIFEIQFDDQNKGGTGNDASMAFGFQRTQFYAPSGIGWGDGKARRWLVDEFLKEKRIDGKNDLRLYGSILYRGFSQDFPDQPKKYYGFENALFNNFYIFFAQKFRQVTNKLRIDMNIVILA